MIAAFSGCVFGHGEGGIIPAPGTIERARVDADRKYLNHCAEVYDSIADRLERGEVIEKSKAISDVNKETGEYYAKDFKPIKKMLDDAAERGGGEKYGKREIKIWRALAKGCRLSAGGDGKHKSRDNDED